MPHPPRIAKLVKALLGGTGETSPALRQAVEARAASAGGAVRAPVEVPHELTGFIDKVARHAYKITDEDFARLRAAGYTDDAVFELTLSAALGASLARLERGMAALQEES